MPELKSEVFTLSHSLLNGPPLFVAAKEDNKKEWGVGGVLSGGHGVVAVVMVVVGMVLQRW
jgi:hypothetical protein